MTDVKEVLITLGYDEIRPVDGRWHPIEELNGRFGTTDETHLIRKREAEEIRLVDAETREHRATARISDSPLE